MPALTTTRDDSQFDALFAAEFGYVWNSLRRLGIPARDVEDVAHDVFVAIFRKIATFDPARPVRPWLFAFAFRAASDYRRVGRNAREQLGDDGELDAVAPSLPDPLEQDEERTLVEKALDAVPPERRLVLVAYEVDEMPMVEIARALAIPLQTAYSRLRVARQEFAATVSRLQLRRGPR